MNGREGSESSWTEAAAILGVAAGAGEEQLRAAYLDKVRRHPPDREPDMFEKIRDAYDKLRDPAARARWILEGPNPDAPLPEFLNAIKPERKFVGAGPWLEVLKESRA